MKRLLAVSTMVGLLSSVVLASDIELKIGARTMAMDYSEYSKVDGSLLDTEESGFDPMMGGLEFSISKIFNKRESEYTKVELNTGYVYGNSDYIGSILDSGNPYGSLKSKTLNTIIDTDISIKEYAQEDGYDLFIGAGLGYRFWKRELSTTQEEDYKWFYLKASVGGNYEINEEFTLGLEGYYEYAIEPLMSATGTTADFELGGVDTLGLSIPLTYKYSKKMSLYVEGSFEQQKIKESSNNVQAFLSGTWKNMYEPRSTSNDFYLKFGFIFKY
jgi:hypothetical protein